MAISTTQISNFDQEYLTVRQSSTTTSSSDSEVDNSLVDVLSFIENGDSETTTATTDGTFGFAANSDSAGEYRYPRDADIVYSEEITISGSWSAAGTMTVVAGRLAAVGRLSVCRPEIKGSVLSKDSQD